MALLDTCNAHNYTIVIWDTDMLDFCPLCTAEKELTETKKELEELEHGLNNS